MLSIKLFAISLIFCYLGRATADTYANCTFDDAMGTWKVDVYKYNKELTIDGDKLWSTTFTFAYPNLVTNEFGHMGHWTMIYNQGFEANIDNRKWLFMFWSKPYTGSEKGDYECDKTLVAWTHDKTVRQWYNMVAHKTTVSSTPRVKTLKPNFENQHNLYRRNRRLIDDINRIQKSWTAVHYKEYDGMTLSQMKKRAGTPVFNSSIPKPAPISPALRRMVESLPDSFDWRSPHGGPSYVTPVRNQLNCGSCYAFASAAALEARIQVFTNRTLRPILSPQDIVDCSAYSQGCNGGFAYLIAGKYAQDFGFVEESCNPYKGVETGSCHTETTCRRYYTANYRYLGGYYGACNEALMKLELVHRGPFPVGIMVYDDFMHYRGGVYVHTGLKDTLNKFNPFELTNHAVLLVGYGYDEELKMPYWTIKNSWSPEWGENGYVRILRGKDEISVESLAVTFTPMF